MRIGITWSSWCIIHRDSTYKKIFWTLIFCEFTAAAMIMCTFYCVNEYLYVYGVCDQIIANWQKCENPTHNKSKRNSTFQLKIFYYQVTITRCIECLITKILFSNFSAFDKVWRLTLSVINNNSFNTKSLYANNFVPNPNKLWYVIYRTLNCFCSLHIMNL